MLSLASELTKATSTIELATRLGRVCLHEDETIRDQLRDPVAEKHRQHLESCVNQMDRALWLAPGLAGDFTHVLDDDAFAKALARVEVYPPLEFLAVLKGMLGAVRRFYDSTAGTVDLKPGTPMPIPKRGINRLFKPTPDTDTSDLGELLWKSGFALFAPRPGAPASVRLDFRAADLLDELTWGERKRLPRIATIHPPLGKGGIEIEETTPHSFFGVRPRKWDRDAVLRQLRRVASKSEIALLPELSLPQADDLEDAIARAPTEFPRLIVAGSAHVREGSGEREVRANESRIYLDGECIGRHRKIHAFVLRRELDGTKIRAPLTEGISGGRRAITVLAGDYTRLAVMICSDLISRKLPGQLEDAEVNLLLVPALTPEPGSFNGKICKLASDCQAVSVIANCDPAVFEGRRPPPFQVMAAVPRPWVGEQSREFRRGWRNGGRMTAVIDPNRRLRRALRWL